jgi:hypothetical protein
MSKRSKYGGTFDEVERLHGTDPNQGLEDILESFNTCPTLDEVGCNKNTSCFWGRSTILKKPGCLSIKRKKNWKKIPYTRKVLSDTLENIVVRNRFKRSELGADQGADQGAGHGVEQVSVLLPPKQLPGQVPEQLSDKQQVENQNKTTLNLDEMESILFWLCIHVIYKKLGGIYDWNKRTKSTPFKVAVLSNYKNINYLGRYIIEGKYVGDSNHSIYKLNDILIIFFDKGSPFTEEDVQFSNISHKDYDKLILCGHSMGAGLSYLFTTKIIENTQGLLGKEFDFSNLYVYTTGLGRVPSNLADKFKEYYFTHNFKCVDLIAINKEPPGNYVDDYLDSITVTSDNCDAYNRKSPFYCKNATQICTAGNNTLLDQSRCKPVGCGTKAISSIVEKRNNDNLDTAVSNGYITDDEKIEYGDCVKINWGPIYGEKWNKCQDLYDKFHKHNEVNTFSLNSSDGIIESINKNTLLRTLEVTTTVCVNSESKYHKFKAIYSSL